MFNLVLVTEMLTYRLLINKLSSEGCGGWGVETDREGEKLISFTNFSAQFIYSLTICMLHYNPRHVLSINMPIFRRTNYIISASGIVTVCKRLYSMPDECRLSLLSSGISYYTMMYGKKINKKKRDRDILT